MPLATSGMRTALLQPNPPTQGASVRKPLLFPLAAAAVLLLWPQATVGSQPGLDPADDKVTICHVPPGNPENAHEITVGYFASVAHLALHDDTIGSCEDDPQNT
jgi:hypothetical protein